MALLFLRFVWWRWWCGFTLFLMQAYEFDTGNEEDDKLTRALINELVSCSSMCLPLESGSKHTTPAPPPGSIFKAQLLRHRKECPWKDRSRRRFCPKTIAVWCWHSLHDGKKKTRFHESVYGVRLDPDSCGNFHTCFCVVCMLIWFRENLVAWFGPVGLSDPLYALPRRAPALLVVFFVCPHE